MTKLILKSTNLHSLNDAENIDLGDLYFDINQFKMPKAFVFPKSGYTMKVEKEKNPNGEVVETGKLTIIFKAYDRPFIELILQSGGTEIGSPITVVIEKQNSDIGDKLKEELEKYEDDELVPISFIGLKVKPKKVQKKSYVAQGKPMAEIWQYAEIKIEADSYIIGEANESKK